MSDDTIGRNEYFSATSGRIDAKHRRGVPRRVAAQRTNDFQAFVDCGAKMSRTAAATISVCSGFCPVSSTPTIGTHQEITAPPK